MTSPMHHPLIRCPLMGYMIYRPLTHYVLWAMILFKSCRGRLKYTVTAEADTTVPSKVSFSRLHPLLRKASCE